MDHGLLLPVKAALAGWMAGFHGGFYPDTPALREWSQRDLKAACMWAASRMVDDVEAVLSSWRKDHGNAPSGKGTSAYLPIAFLAMANELNESTEAGYFPSARYLIRVPDHDQIIGLRVIPVELRAQVAVVAADHLSAMSMMMQLMAWARERRSLESVFVVEPLAPLAAISRWPVQIVQAERQSIATPINEQIKVMTVDLTLRAVLPLFSGPGPGDLTDGANPPGFAQVSEVRNTFDPYLGVPNDVTPAHWYNYLERTGVAGVELSGVVPAPGVGGPVASMPGNTGVAVAGVGDAR